MSEQYTADREALRAAARAMAAARRVVGPIKCEVCGAQVIATTAGAPDKKRRYCSTACTQRAYYQRHRDAIRARQRERYAARRAAAASAVDDGSASGTRTLGQNVGPEPHTTGAG